jgi:hypothetical protein
MQSFYSSKAWAHESALALGSRAQESGLPRRLVAEKGRFLLIALTFILVLVGLMNFETVDDARFVANGNYTSHLIMSGVSPKAYPGMCRMGRFQTLQQWRQLFHNEVIPFEQKALVFIAIGGHAKDSIRTLVRSMGFRAFDFLFVAYDDYYWEKEEWFGNVIVVRHPKGFKWRLAYEYLTPARIAPYSHLFLWDDDVIPTETFDAEVMLHVLQQIGLNISQPVIRENFHLPATKANPSSKTQVHEIPMVEIMVPMYSVDTYLRCIWPHIVADDSGTGWGLDLFLHRRCPTARKLYSLEFALDHLNSKSMQRVNTIKSADSSAKYAELVSSLGHEGVDLKNRLFADYVLRLHTDCTIVLYQEEFHELVGPGKMIHHENKQLPSS